VLSIFRAGRRRQDAGQTLVAYGIVPTAKIVIPSTPVAVVLVAGFAIGIDLRVRRRMRGNLPFLRGVTGAPARPPLGKRTGGFIKMEGRGLRRIPFLPLTA
jgi:hypothetical protein